jgi:membrane protease YdiL (CAAX protease family)
MEHQPANDGRAQGVIARHPVLAFFVLAFAISWGGILVITRPTGIPGHGAALDGLLVPVFLAMLAGPFVAAIALSFVWGGRAGLAALFRGFTIWRFGWANLALATGLIPLCALAVLLPLSVVSPAYTPGFLDEGGGLAMIALSLAGGLMVALIEETGWTGYATPRLLARHGVMVVAVVLGVIHGVWHFMSNVWFDGAESGLFFLPIFLTAWILAIVNLRVLAVRLYRKSGGSTLIGAITHASHTGGLLAIWPVATAPAQDLAWTTGFAGVGALALWFVIRRGWI